MRREDGAEGEVAGDGEEVGGAGSETGIMREVI